MGYSESKSSHGVGWKGHITFGAIVLGLLAVVIWRLGSPGQEIDHTYDLVTETGRWTFPAFRGRVTDDAVYLAFQRDWGHPAGDDKAIAKDAWKARMTTLCELARMGNQTLPILLRGLDDNDKEVRDLAAQAIGYLGDLSVIARLDQAIRQDPSPTVRIYSTIARSSITGGLPNELAEDILKHDPQSMVRARLELARLQGQNTNLTSARSGLESYDLSTMDSARVGTPAPDFSLVDLDGHRHRLSDYRGKKNVAVVFVYGVTCMFCTGQIANLRGKLDEFEALGTQVLIVEANNSSRVHATSAEAATLKTGARLPILLDPSHTAAATFGVAMQMNHVEWLNRPATFLIDRQGILQTRFLAQSPSDRPTPSQLLSEIRKIQASQIDPFDDRLQIPNREL